MHLSCQCHGRLALCSGVQLNGRTKQSLPLNWKLSIYILFFFTCIFLIQPVSVIIKAQYRFTSIVLDRWVIELNH